MNASRVLCLGEILFDNLADQAGRALAAVESWTPYPGGAPANVACALTKLGTPAAFIGCLGADEAGQTLQALLADIGVETRGVQVSPTAPTRQVYVLRSESGDRAFAGFGGAAPGSFADAQLHADAVPADLFAGADFLVLGTLELAYPAAREAVWRSLELARQHRVAVVLDANWRPMFWDDPAAAMPLVETLWPQVTYLKLAREEAELFFETADAEQIARCLSAVNTSLRGILITDGDRPLQYWLAGRAGTIEPFAVSAIDTTGAGDSFVAGFVHQLCTASDRVAEAGDHPFADPAAARSALTYACAVGALTTLKPGAIAAQPNPAEVADFLATQQPSSKA